ncbi:T9SS type A sorting domain-containing protein [Chryseobacterium sp. 3008163]|uniref:T9SS type A sorting domain-containing protein n=1 Tax=Chryseobacterium sp. 3008163 TaxID=2478663 RepID=UPI000F0C63EB|nr:T9SS type A sorting domain-containing protein [Chryseobacterium sp. 3008163]AYN00658.1 T9SS C-terminal target domain-containing protein [Chryseobacterium sp. 3008163]
MKKVLLSLGILSCLSINAQTLLSEGFEGTTFPPTGWTATSTVATRPWQATPLPVSVSTWFTLAGTKSAGVDYTNQANTANLVTPSFSLVGAASPILKFKVTVGWVYMIRDNAGDLLVQISTNGGSLWTNLWNEDNQVGWSDDGDGLDATDTYQNINVQINLSPYIGQANVQVRFRYVANDADAVAIDDVQVLATTLSTDEVSKSKTSIYPNPTKGEINIKTDKKIKSSTVYDLTGKVLLQTNSEKVNINSFTKGTYLLKVEFADGSTQSEKILKD